MPFWHQTVVMFQIKWIFGYVPNTFMGWHIAYLPKWSARKKTMLGRPFDWAVASSEAAMRPISKTAAAEQQRIKESPLRLKRSRCIKGITKEAMIDSDKLRIILPSVLTSSFSVTMRRAWKGTFYEHLFVVLRWPNKSCWERLPLSLNIVSPFRHKWLYFSFGLHTWKSGRHAWSSLANVLILEKYPNDIYEYLYVVIIRIAFFRCNNTFSPCSELRDRSLHFLQQRPHHILLQKMSQMRIWLFLPMQDFFRIP